VTLITPAFMAICHSLSTTCHDQSLQN